MIDSHCHLDFPDFDPDRPEVLKRCQSEGITDIVIPGTQISGWANLLSLINSTEHPIRLHGTLGIHPYFISQHNDSHLTQLHSLIEQNRDTLVGVGEIGLDYYIAHNDSELQQKQQAFFIAQVEMAMAFRLPIVVHHRRSHNDLIRVLKSLKPAQGGVIHSFSGSYEEARTYVDMGFYLGVGGTITYERAQKTRDALKQIGLQYLLLETDAPDMPMHGRQGQRNSPEFLPRVLQSLASLYGESSEHVEHCTSQNTRHLFGLTQ